MDLTGRVPGKGRGTAGEPRKADRSKVPSSLSKAGRWPAGGQGKWRIMGSEQGAGGLGKAKGRNHSAAWEGALGSAVSWNNSEVVDRSFPSP